MLNFSIKELIHSDIAHQNNINNTPNIEQCDNLLNLIFYVLQPIRDKIKKPITVTSGFRCPKVNFFCGGAVNSNHLKGCAADIIPAGNNFKEIYDYVVNNLDYDECFIETNSKGKKWLHIAYVKGQNRKKHNPNYIA